MRFIFSTFFCTCMFLLILVSCMAVSASEPKIPKQQVGKVVYWAPDHALRASVVYLKPRGYGWAESRVEIQTANGDVLARQSYSSECGTSGYTVMKAAWTPDGHFWVYSLESSGGHHPWHRPTSFYSRHHHKFYSLDALLGAITGSFRLGKPCIMMTRGRCYTTYPGVKTQDSGDGSGEKSVTIDLGRIKRFLKRSIPGKE